MRCINSKGSLGSLGLIGPNKYSVPLSIAKLLKCRPQLGLLSYAPPTGGTKSWVASANPFLPFCAAHISKPTDGVEGRFLLYENRFAQLVCW